MNQRVHCGESWIKEEFHKGFPCGSAGKESTCNAGDLGSIPRLGRSPGEVKGRQLPTSVFWPRKFYGQRSLAGYSPCGFKESDTTEWLSLDLTSNLLTLIRAILAKGWEQKPDSLWSSKRMLWGYFPGGSDGKESAWHAGDLGSIPRLGRSSGEGNGYPIKYSCLENPMDRGTYSPIVPIVGYSAWGHKESDMTEATQQPHVYKVTFCIRKGRNLTY